MAEITASQLVEGESYLYGRGAGPRKEVLILTSEADPGSSAYTIVFKQPNRDAQFNVRVQNGNAMNPVHKFFQLPEELPANVGREEGPREESEDPPLPEDSDPAGGRKRRRRKTAKRKTKKSKPKRRTLKK